MRVNTLKRIEFELFSNLFWEQPQKQHGFKKGDYVKIKHGVYEGDIALINQASKHFAMVQVVPRVNFITLE